MSIVMWSSVRILYPNMCVVDKIRCGCTGVSEIFGSTLSFLVHMFLNIVMY